MRSKINDEARISLMLESISNIDSFMEGVVTYETFEGNKIICHAVAYNLQCIGESVYKLSSDFLETHKEIDWTAIEGLRHVLVHDYYSVNMRTIWGIIEKDLPELKLYLNSL